MSIVTRSRKPFAAFVAAAVVVTGLALAPATAASAASNSSMSASVMKVINHARTIDDQKKLRKNNYLETWAQKNAELIAKKGSIYADVTNNSKIPVDPATGALPADEDVLIYNVSLGGSESDSKKVARIADAYVDMGKGHSGYEDYNFASAGVYKKSGTMYVSVIYIDYAKTPDQRMKAGSVSISGTAQVGKLLTAKVGSWSPKPSTYYYAWKVSGKTVGTKSTLRVQPAYKGKTIVLTVTGKKSGYTSIKDSSKYTAKVKAGKLSAKTPVINNGRKVGYTLAASTGGSWGTDVKYSYTWLRNGKFITSSTTTNRYKLVAADKGKIITVKVTGKKSGYANASKYSSSKVAKVKG